MMKTALISATLLAMTLGTASLPNQGRVYGFFSWPGLARRGAVADHPLPIAGQPPQTAGAIIGTVLGDDSHPLIGATVSVTSRAGKGEVGSHLTAQTDGTGVFKIPSLPEGEYEISVSARGYLREYAMDSAQQNHVPRTIHPGETVSIVLKKGGVITGKVLTEDGEPLIEAPVVAESYRDRFGRILRGRSSYGVEKAETDDRGIYRIYGLPEGSYLIKVGKDRRFSSLRSTYDGNAPFYYPSAHRESAVEVPVRPGQEVTSIDIRYRAVHGFSISGMVGDGHSNRPEALPLVTLFDSSTGTVAGFVYASWAEEWYRFTLEGIPSGEYDLLAERSESPDDEGGQSAPVHLTVDETDVSGVTLHLVSLGSAAGRVVVDLPRPEIAGRCNEQRTGRLSDVSVTAVPERTEQWPADVGFPSTRADPDGQFAIRRLPAERYYFTAWLPQPSWYLKSITAPGAAEQSPPMNAGHDGLKLKTGEKAIGMVFTIGVGAGYLGGRVLPPAEGASLSEYLRVIAVPQEPEAADDVLRYVEMRVRNGSYSSHHFPPGRYRLVAGVVLDTRTRDSEIPLLIWKHEEREKLRREATKVGVPIEVRPCENLMVPNITFAAPKEH